MSEYSKYLGDAVKQARSKTTLTQAQVAEKANIDNRTVLNIENNKGNPKLEVLYPLIKKTGQNRTANRILFHYCCTSFLLVKVC